MTTLLANRGRVVGTRLAASCRPRDRVAWAVLAAAVAVLASTVPARGADEIVKAGPDTLMFAARDKAVARLFAKTAVTFLSPEVLWLEDQATGRAVDTRAITLQWPERLSVSAGEIFQIEIAPTRLYNRGQTLNGRLGIRYEVAQAPGKVAELLTWNFTMVADGLSALIDARSAELEFVTVTGTPAVASKIPIDPGSTFQVCLLAKKTGVAVLASQVTAFDVFDQTRGAPAGAATIVVTSAPVAVSLSRPACIQLKQAAIPDSAMRITGTLVVPYRPLSATAEVKKALWTFELARPATKIAMGLNNAFAIASQRDSPFHDQRIRRCVPYTPAPLLANLDAAQPIQAEIYVDGTQPRYIERAAIKAAPGPSRDICLEATIPRGITAMKGRIRIGPPGVAETTEFAATFQMKDRVRWRALTVTVAYLLAFVFYWLTTGVRARIEHQATRGSVLLRLARFLAANPSLVEHDVVVFIRQLLLESEQQDKAADFAGAATTLTSAAARMTQLETAPPAAPTTVGESSGPAIRVLDPPERMVAGRSLMFRIGNAPPEWTPGSVFAWRVRRVDDNTVAQIGAGRNLVSVRHRFPRARTATNWIVEVEANGVPAARGIALAGDDAGIGQRLRALNLAPQLVAVSLAALAAYVATNTTDTWGTSTDYVNLFLAALGVSGGAQGFAAMLQVLRH